MLNELIPLTLTCISAIGEAVQKKNHRFVPPGTPRQSTSFSTLLPPLPKERSDYSAVIIIITHVIVTFLCMQTMCI